MCFGPQLLLHHGELPRIPDKESHAWKDMVRSAEDPSISSTGGSKGYDDPDGWVRRPILWARRL